MKVGTKMIGNWGAMIPLSFGSITQVKGSEVFIAWDDMPGSVSYDFYEINKGQMLVDDKQVGIGVYTEDQYYNL